MAVITRKTLQDRQAISIKNKALSQASAYNPNIAAFQQQRDILGGTQQNLVTSAKQTLGDVNQSIYRSQRQSRAASAAQGLIGSVNQSRDASDLQQKIGYDLGNIIDQAEQGAVSIASQQSALNQAETTTVQTEIMDIYADELIEGGSNAVNGDWVRQLQSGLSGAVGGALAGAGLGFLGPKALNVGLKGGKIATAGMAAAGIVGPMAAVDFVANIGNDYKSKEYREMAESQSYADSKKTSMLVGGGVGVGLGLLGSKRLTSSGLNKGFWTSAMRGGTGTVAGAQATGMKGVLKTAGKGFFKATPLTLAMAGIGAVAGGLNGGLDKKYKLDYNKLMTSGTAKDFASMGLDLSAMNDIIYNK